MALQAPFPHFAIPDYPLPKGTPIFPEAKIVLKYIQDYANHFDVIKHVQFNVEVKEIQQNKDFTWTVVLGNGTKKTYDFLVIAMGLFKTPYIPKIENSENFRGTILHSTEVINAEEFVKDKHVVVIGGKKSAWDINRLILQYTDTVHWVSRKNALSISLDNRSTRSPFIRIYLSRLLQFFIPAVDGSTGIIYDYMKPLVKLYFSFVNSQNRTLPDELKFEHDLPSYIPVQGAVVRNSEVINAVNSRKLKIHHGTVSKFVDDGIIINDDYLKADVVIFCTGFSMDNFGFEKKWLYKNTILPEVKNLAFLGLSRLASSPLYANLQAFWLCEVLRGAFSLPSVTDMNEYCSRSKNRITQCYGDFPGVQQSQYMFSLVDEIVDGTSIRKQRRDTVWKNYTEVLRPIDYTTAVTHGI